MMGTFPGENFACPLLNSHDILSSFSPKQYDYLFCFHYVYFETKYFLPACSSASLVFSFTQSGYWEQYRVK